MRQIDLHVHSLASDGTMTPAELVSYAEQKGLAAFALTDHDTVAGIPQVMEAAKNSPVQVIPGVEISCQYKGRDVHMLGLNIDYQNQALMSRLEEFRASRTVRNEKMVALLAADGLDISMEQLDQEFPGAIVTRSHIAKHLMIKRYVGSINEGFEKYVGPNAPYYVPRERISPEQAITWIHQAGGKAVFAHPLLCRFPYETLLELIQLLKDAGLDGLEALYSYLEPKELTEADMKKLAADFGLFITGGSDFHGENKPLIDLGCGKGDLFVPEELLENIV